MISGFMQNSTRPAAGVCKGEQFIYCLTVHVTCRTTQYLYCLYVKVTSKYYYYKYYYKYYYYMHYSNIYPRFTQVMSTNKVQVKVPMYKCQSVKSEKKKVLLNEPH